MIEIRSIHKDFEVDFEQPNDAPQQGLESPVLDISTNTVTLVLTAEQFRQFLSAIEQGAEIIYPDKQHELTDIFVQGLQ